MGALGQVADKSPVSSAAQLPGDLFRKMFGILVISSLISRVK